MPEFVADRHQCPKCERRFWSASSDPVPNFCPYCGRASAIGNPLLWYEHVAHIQQYPSMRDATTIEAAMDEVAQEYYRAICHFPRFNSAHEGWAILREEVDELWEEVKRKPSDVNPIAMRREAIQAAAMGLRFVVDVCKGVDRDAPSFRDRDV